MRSPDPKGGRLTPLAADRIGRHATRVWRLMPGKIPTLALSSPTTGSYGDGSRTEYGTFFHCFGAERLSAGKGAYFCAELGGRFLNWDRRFELLRSANESCR